MAYDEPQWFSRITDVSTIIDAQTGRELALESNRAAPPSGERGPEYLSQSAQASLLTTRFYTLTGGTTNRTQGPGQLFTGLLDQIEAASGRQVQERLLQQVADLSRDVAQLAADISQSADRPLPSLSAEPFGASPETELPDLAITDSDITEPAIE